MRRIDMSDANFLYIESRETPMHVAGLYLFNYPERVNRQRFMQRLKASYRSATEFRRPFGEYVTTGKLGPLGPYYWAEDEEIDMEYHVRHSALPAPGRYLELFSLVSRLHGTLLDRSRPLWEVHLIEGLQDDQFAIYSKMHHATIDGIGAARLTEGICSTNKRDRIYYSPFSLEALEKFKASRKIERPPANVPSIRELRSVAEVFKRQLGTSANLLGLLKDHASTWLGRREALAVPFHHVPRTSINMRITGARRFVAQSWEIERIRAVGKAVGAKLNDVVLAMCSGALRRYMMEHDQLPKHSLRAMVPVSIRASGDVEAANAVSLMTANLGTRFADPEDRLRTIMDSTRAGKEMLSGLSKREAQLYVTLASAPMLLTSLLGVADRFPSFSTTISNVPGPMKQMYWNGAKLNGIYPLSAILHGMALNITLVGYHKHLDFGIVACRRTVPQVQRLIDYLEDSLLELEDCVGIA